MYAAQQIWQGPPYPAKIIRYTGHLNAGGCADDSSCEGVGLWESTTELPQSLLGRGESALYMVVRQHWESSTMPGGVWRAEVGADLGPGALNDASNWTLKTLSCRRDMIKYS